MYKAKASVLVGLLACSVFLGACSSTGVLGDGGKVAVVNGTVITKAVYDKTYEELQKAFHLEKLSTQQQGQITDTLRQMTLNKLILQTLINSAAQKAGLQVTDSDVQQYKKEKIFSNPTLKQQFSAFLEQNQMKESDFDNILKENLLLNKFMDAEGGKAIQVSDAEVKAFYDKNVEQFKLPARVHAAHILIKAIEPQMKQDLRTKNPKITDEELNKQIAAEKQTLKAKADQLYAQIKADPSKFEDLARKNSDDPMSAKQGGDLGELAQNTVDPAFWAAADKTPDGQFYPGVVTTQFGYHIIKVLQHKAPHQDTFEEAKGIIRDHLAQEKKQAFIQKWAQDAKSAAKIEVEPAYKPKKEEVATPGQGQGGVVPRPGGMNPNQQGAGAPQASAPTATASKAPVTQHQ